MAKSRNFSLDTKSTCVSLIVKTPKDTPYSFPVDYLNDLDLWLSLNASDYAYILHNLDVLEDGTPKRWHVHVWARLNACQRLRTTLNSVCDGLKIDTEQVEVDKAVSMEGCVQYMTHQNEPEKTQYAPHLIRCSFDQAELKAILEQELCVLSLTRLVSLCGSSPNLVNVISKLGISVYERHRNLVKDVWNSCHGRN